ncbi:Uncharacterised protein [Serratia odorifera]|uniref:Uncharacterized protein n=1 Tax=Serratia odorifera TaxID=618 RepID=A0A447KP03_SEROD|nr:Uncharacterised protein [Serratia odorifera]
MLTTLPRWQSGRLAPAPKSSADKVKLMRLRKGQRGRLLRQSLMLTAPALLLMGCTVKPPSSPPDWQQVNAPAVPQLPAEARQEPLAASCLPSCSAALTSERENWRQLLIRQGSEG